jgi:hypothetical protein
MAAFLINLLVGVVTLPLMASSSNILEIMSGKSVDEVRTTAFIFDIVNNANWFIVRWVNFFLQFKKLLDKSTVPKQYLQNELTIFAPSDKALSKYVGPKDDQFILNHMGTQHFFIIFLFTSQ